MIKPRDRRVEKISDIAERENNYIGVASDFGNTPTGLMLANDTKSIHQKWDISIIIRDYSDWN